VASSPESADFVEDQLAGLDIRTAKMFGEYAVYCDGKVVGLICDDDFFIKPSAADAALFRATEPAPPYPGAKDYHRVPGDLLEDREWLQQAVQATADALPVPPPKKPRPRAPARLPHPRRPPT
jgi:TfoX/Sxy family transcriptional regulator of competence genes